MSRGKEKDLREKGKGEEYADKEIKRRRRVYANVVINYFETNQLGARIVLLHPICVQRCYDDIAHYSPTQLLRRKIM
jgi:hypothetical protein